MSPIEALMSGDVQAFRTYVNDTLMAKLSDRLDQERVAVASNMFANPEEAEAPEGQSEEELESEVQ